MLAALHTLTDPWAEPVVRRALLEVALLGRDRRRAGLLDRLLRPLLQRRVAGPRAAAGARHRRAHGRPAAARRRRRPARRRARDRRRRPGAGHRPRHRGRGRGHDAVRRRRAARALARLAAGAAEPALRRRPRRLGRRPRARRRAGRRSSSRALALLHAPAAGRRLRPPQRAGRSACARCVVDLALLALVALALLVAVQGLGNLLVVAVLRRPGVGRAAGGAADGADDGGVGRRRRASPASAGCTSPTTPAPPRAPRSRRCSSPPTCWRASAAASPRAPERRMSQPFGAGAADARLPARTTPGAVSGAPHHNGHRRPPSIAVVGGGFGGVGAVVDAAPRRLRGRHRLRARRADRRRLAPQHLSRRRLRRPVAPLRVLVRAEPALVAPLRAAGRDPGLPRGRRAAPRRARPHPHAHRGAAGALGRRARHVGAADERRPARGRRAAHRLRPALGARRCRRSRASTASRARPSTPRGGATTSTSPASASRWSAPAAARSRSCPRSSRSSSTSTSTSARRAGRSRRWTSPTRSARSGCSSASRVLQRLDRAGDLRLHGARRRRDDEPALAAAALPRASRAGRSPKAIDDPELRRKVTPRDEVGCKRIMLTDEWYPTLTQPNVELVTDRIAEVTPTGIRTEDGVERPADVLVLATGFKTHGFVAPMEIVGAGGRTLAEEWARRAARLPRHERARLPEHVPALRAEHQRRHRLGHLHDRGRDGPRDRRARRARARRRARRSRCGPRPPRPSTASCAPRWPTPSGTPGCTNWYVDENGNDPNQWPWLWSTYRRRTAQIEPGTYELSPS